MSRIAVNLLGWNHKALLKKCINSVRVQSYKDFELFYMDNASKDGSVEFVKNNYPFVNIIENKQNLGYAGGHNKFFEALDSEFLMVLNPDVELSANFLEEVVKGFEDSEVGAAMGKLLRPSSKLIDSTGIIINLARRGRDRGQWEEDNGQYDNQTNIFGVNGAASVFRKSALEKVKMPKISTQYSVHSTQYEYFDEDFFAYWEDLDLSWRLNLAGFKCKFAPSAVAYHGRAAGQSKGGYKKIFSFIKHHRNLPKRIRQLNWKNHQFCIIKNDFGWKFIKVLPIIKLRELSMLVYILFFEPSTLAVILEYLKQLPKMLRKRKYIKKNIANAAS